MIRLLMLIRAKNDNFLRYESVSQFEAFRYSDVFDLWVVESFESHTVKSTLFFVGPIPKAISQHFCFCQVSEFKANCDNEPTNKNNGSLVELCHFISCHSRLYARCGRTRSQYSWDGDHDVQSMLKSPLTGKNRLLFIQFL